MTSLEMENLLRQLKSELGIDKSVVKTSGLKQNLSEYLSSSNSTSVNKHVIHPPAPPNR